ncbi:MAG TPA: PEGA domain-containing protein [Polyangia bacterium]|nr:PEGA domain-containing protein [Polyangia bacterium]
MSRWFVWIAVGAAATVVAVPGARAGGTDDAEKLIRHGIELRKAHDDEGAARAFQQAYDQVHTPRAAGQLGLAEQALGRWEDAERHVGEALHATGDSWVAKNRATLDEALGTIEAHLGRVEVLGDPEGAEVSVNGRSVGKLPLADAVRVSAGEVDVEMHAPGYVPAQRTLNIVGGQYQRLVLHLAKESAPEVTTAGPKPAGGEASVGAGPASGAVTPIVKSTPVEEPPSQARAVVKWSAAGLAVVGLAVGVTATILHANNVSKFDAHSPTCAVKNGMGVGPDGNPNTDCQNLLSAYQSDTTWAIVGFAGAGAFAVTWLVLQLTEGPSHPAPAEQAMARPLCVPSTSGLGLSCAVRF